jgi:pimeloyl-ACP methyl ester carboxylesterase
MIQTRLVRLSLHLFHGILNLRYKPGAVMFRQMLVIIVAGVFMMALPRASAQDELQPQSGYAAVNDLKIYYEIHGTGEPLILLHGAYMSIDGMGEIVTRLAETRQVIAVELQGHGRTNDVDRPLSYEQMADDVAMMMDVIGIEKADIFGYSMGGNTALQLTLRHPEKVRKLVIAGATYKTEGLYPEMLAGIESITPELFAGSPMEDEYKRLAPNPDGFATLVTKLVQLDSQVQDWSSEAIQAITSPTLIIIGDSDVVRPEHAVEMFRLVGGGVPGDLAGLPNSQLAVLPGTTHVTLISRVDLLEAMIVEFLDTPLPDTQ